MREESGTRASTTSGDRFLEPLVPEAVSSGSSHHLPRGTRVAQFTVQRFVKEGGSCEVYLALQESPRRKVALKLLRRHLVGTPALLRFEREAQVLAQLQHDSIATVHAAWSGRATSAEEGSTGRPWIALEWVEGEGEEPETITKHCRDTLLDLHGRLRLFRKVVGAIEHAHLHDVVHRDLKPSNILVDRLGRPKMIDFGIAHLRERGAGAITGLTLTGEVLGTIRYTSPEQLEGRRVDVHTDLYSLGVVLYEILCGRLPYRRPDASEWDIGTQIRGEGVVRPNRSDGIAHDLACILLHCLQKDPKDRYQSAAELAADLDRFLSGERVLARAPHPLVDLWRLARRHPVSALLTASLGTALGVMVTVAWVQSFRADNAADRALSVKDYLVEMWRAPGGSLSLHDPLTLELALATATAHVGSAFAQDPLGQAELTGHFGTAYRLMGDLEHAEPLLERSLALYRSELGREDARTLEVQQQLAILRFKQSRWQEAEELLRSAIAYHRETLAEDDPRVLHALGWLANVLLSQGRAAEAEECLDAVERGRAGALEEEDREILSLRSAIASLRRLQGKHAEAEQLFRATLELQRRHLPADDLDTAVTANNYALLLSDLGRATEAKVLLEEVLTTYTRTFGPDHPSTWTALNNLASTKARLGTHRELPESEREAHEAEQIFSRLIQEQEHHSALGPRHENSIRTRLSLGRLLLHEHRIAEAADVIEPTLAHVDETWPAHFRTYANGSAGIAHALLGNSAVAERLLLVARASARDHLESGDPFLLEVEACLAGVMCQVGRPDEAFELLEPTRQGWLRAFPQQPAWVLECDGIRGEIHDARGELADAEQVFYDTLEKALEQDDVFSVASARARFGLFLHRHERFEEAEEHLVSALPAIEAALGSGSPRARAALEAAAQALEARGAREAAAPFRARLGSSR